MLTLLWSLLQTSLPGILPGTSGVRMPHWGHLPGVTSITTMTTLFLYSLCVFIKFATRGRCQRGSPLQCKIRFRLPLNLGSPFLQYARHLTDFIHLSLSLCLFPYFHHLDGSIACFFCLFLWYKTKTLSNCLFKGSSFEMKIIYLLLLFHFSMHGQ